jgi:putative two-component system response regulator
MGSLISGTYLTIIDRELMKKPTILIVDDDLNLQRLTAAFLEDMKCEIATANNGVEALEFVAANPPDLILMDVNMPEMDGYEACKRIKADPLTQFIPIVMVTALSELDDRVQALEVGADDFLTKPVQSPELIARVTSLLKMKASLDRLEDSEQVIFMLARAVEAKDPYGEAHSERVARMSREVGAQMGLDEDVLDDLYRGAMLHDIGKIGVSDVILMKHGPLTPVEEQELHQHPIIGEKIIQPLRSAHNLLSIVRNHHENFDGSGYPDRLKGEEIPLLARIVSVCNAYDALASRKAFKSGQTPSEALAQLKEEAGTKWDQEIVDRFANGYAFKRAFSEDTRSYSSRGWSERLKKRQE